MTEPGTGPEETIGPHGVETPEGGPGPVCQVAWCPFCLAVGAVQPIKPEMVEHLLKAGTELLLAFRSVIETRSDDVRADGAEGGSGPTRLEKIELG